jgi:hypothetical protein
VEASLHIPSAVKLHLRLSSLFYGISKVLEIALMCTHSALFAALSDDVIYDPVSCKVARSHCSYLYNLPLSFTTTLSSIVVEIMMTEWLTSISRIDGYLHS